MYANGSTFTLGHCRGKTERPRVTGHSQARLGVAFHHAWCYFSKTQDPPCRCRQLLFFSLSWPWSFSIVLQWRKSRIPTLPLFSNWTILRIQAVSDGPILIPLGMNASVLPPLITILDPSTSRHRWDGRLLEKSVNCWDQDQAEPVRRFRIACMDHGSTKSRGNSRNLTRIFGFPTHRKPRLQ